jgi:D-beta-D-heptose 7-phosphate kinase/D-beta-D-heptose 1-phosphate adenosyltransferase
MVFSPFTFEKKRVLVMGDTMLDRYVWGQVRRISPEAPVPVVQMQRTSELPGGAGNVANNLAGLGCPVSLIGICGNDERAETLRRLMSEKGIAHHLICDHGRPTITKTRVMAQKQQILRLDEERVHTPDQNLLKRVRSVMTAEMANSAAVILSDYGKGMFATHDFTQEVILAARSLRLPVLVDPKGVHWERYQQATCITPNTSELEAVAGVRLEQDEELLIATARQIRSRYDLAYLLVTRSAKGMCLIGPSEQIKLIPARSLEVFDVSGAGDTVIATLAAAVANRAPLNQAAELANIAAGIVVGKLGTQPVLRSELVTAMQFNDKNRYFPYSAAKMTTLEAALAKVAQWRAAGDQIVFTNGCFDLLHPGHISLLYQARALGDRLIVGLNTDASVRRLKGPQRPILSEQDRAAMLGALACVDLVVHFDEDTPLALIGHLKPDVLVKGSDYKPEQVVGKEVVEAYGGRVQLVDLVQGYSTTQLARQVACRDPKTQPG